MLAALVTGLGFGVAVAAQIGPISLLLIRSVMAGRGVRVGVAIGAGAAIVDTAYAALGVAGAAPLVAHSAVRPALGLVGAGLLAVLGARTLWSAMRVRMGAESDAEVSGARRALMTSIAATASNPLTIGSWAAVFAVASAARVARSPAGAIALVAGVGLGSLAWFVVLTLVVSSLRRRLGDRFLAATDVVAGVCLIGFAGALGYRSTR